MNESKYDGMTVNERLFAADLFDDFDTTVQQRDRSKMIAILLRIEMTPEQCVGTVDAILANPQKHGF